MFGIPDFPVPSQQLQQLLCHQMLKFHDLRGGKNDQELRLWPDITLKKNEHHSYYTIFMVPEFQ
jgi:hypothetical protein